MLDNSRIEFDVHSVTTSASPDNERSGGDRAEPAPPAPSSETAGKQTAQGDDAGTACGTNPVYLAEAQAKVTAIELPDEPERCEPSLATKLGEDPAECMMLIELEWFHHEFIETLKAARRAPMSTQGIYNERAMKLASMTTKIYDVVKKHHDKRVQRVIVERRTVPAPQKSRRGGAARKVPVTSDAVAAPPPNPVKRES